VSLTPAELEAAARALAQYVADYDPRRERIASDVFESALAKINNARPNSLRARLSNAIKSHNAVEEN